MLHCFRKGFGRFTALFAGLALAKAERLSAEEDASRKLSRAVQRFARAAQDVLREAVRRNLTVTQFDISYPSLNDVFLAQVRGLAATGVTDAQPEPDLAQVSS